jgi:pyruvate dehydrogenase E1 component
MELLQPATIASGRRMQWVCGADVVDEALAVAAVLARVHGIGIDLWRIDDWAAMAQEGVACERRWRRGEGAEVGSRFERLIAPTQGPILAVTRGPRALPEMLRAFAPAGRRYLSLSGPDVDALLATALRLDRETDIEWAKMSAI